MGPSIASLREGTQDTQRNCEEDVKFPDHYPLRLVPEFEEVALAVVPCSLKIESIDGILGDPTVTFAEIDGIWDTGAHVSVIVEDLLPEYLLQNLKDPKHDPYRDSSGIPRVRDSAILGFLNSAIKIKAIFLIIPKTVVPNERVGILLWAKDLDRQDRPSHDSKSCASCQRFGGI